MYINSALSYFPMPEGRVINNSGTLVQEFIITDPQGNARLSFQNNGSGTAVVKQENSYYGFGLIMPNSPVGTPPTPNKQLYNGGSEWQNDFGNLPDYYQAFYRNYDAALGRFVGVDPVAESAESMTGYQYAGNNPIMMNDPNGDLLPAPGSKNVPFNNWTPLYDSSAPSDVQAQQDAFFEGSGGDGSGSGSPIDGGDYSAFWTGFSYSNLSFSDYKAQYDENNGNFSYGVDMFGTVQYMVPFSSNAYTLLGYSDVNNPHNLDVGIDISQSQFNAVIEQNGGTPPANQGGESLLSQIWNSPLVLSLIHI